MTKIVYNACFGGFGLSTEGIRRYLELKGIPFTEEPSKLSFVGTEFVIGQEADGTPIKFYDFEIEDRTDPALVQVVEELGKVASGSCADLCIEDVPKGTLYRIDEYDGSETVMTQSDYDWKIA